MHDAVYEPREDSYLLQRWVKRRAKGTVLDMGTGSGIQARAVADKKSVESILALDVQPEVIRQCKKHSHNPKITYLTSDLFCALKTKRGKTQRSQRYDTIIFNPPYLPNEPKAPDMALDGGKHGYELTLRFLKEAGDFLTTNGKILLLFSSLTKKDIVEHHLTQNQFDWKELERQHFSFEDLYVYELSKTPLRRRLEKRGATGLRYFTHGKRGTLLRAVWQGMDNENSLHGSFRNRKTSPSILKGGAMPERGFSSIVIKTKNPRSEAAEAIRKEARWLKVVNGHGIGPYYLFSGKGYVAYRYVQGPLIKDWIEDAPTVSIIRVLRKVLEQMAMLDEAKIAKEEMLRPHKHVIITKRLEPVLVDFERSHHTKKPRNVPQFCQYLTSNYIVNLLKGRGRTVDAEGIRRLAKLYKNQPSRRIIKKIGQSL